MNKEQKRADSVIDTNWVYTDSNTNNYTQSYFTSEAPKESMTYSMADLAQGD